MEDDGEGEVEVKNTAPPAPAPAGKKKGGAAAVVVAAAAEPKKKKKEKDPNEGKPDDTRRLLNLVICSIQVEKLIPAHRFKKNTPWLNVLYGKQGNWMAPYQEAEEGDSAEWLELNWSFVLERDTRHRDDLVIIVNSEDVIVGRYILGKADWLNLPHTQSGFFKVSGDIINGLGKAGVVKIVFKKAVALPPKAPRFIENITAADTLNTALPHTSRAYLRIISIACADLKPVSLFEANCPYCVLTCGEKWIKSTDVSIGSGMSAKWNRLPWKLIMGKFEPLVLNVKSVDSLIGRIAFSLDEVFDLPVNNQGFIEIIRPISDGARLTGRVRVVMLMRPMAAEDTMEVFAVSAGEAQRELALGEGQGQDPGDGTIVPENYPQYGRNMEGPDPVVMPKPASYAITGLAPGCPFIMIFKEIGVFDTKQVSKGRPNSLSCNAVCGKWGGSTTELANCGSNALWIDLMAKWKFAVERGTTLRINVWSGTKFLGGCVLTAAQLLDIPVDPDGNMEIMAKVVDEGKTNGRIRIQGMYEWYREHVVVVEKPIQAVTYKPPDARKMEVDIDGLGVPLYELPVLAMVIAISAMDLKAAHGLVPNSPRAKIVCDRKMAQTRPLRFGGRQGRWTDLNWPIPVNEGCVVNVYIYSGDVVIGWAELLAHEIVRVPLNAFGHTVLDMPILDTHQLSTGRVQLQLQLHNVMLEDYEKMAFKEKKNHYDLSPEKPRDIALRTPYAESAEMHSYVENLYAADAAAGSGQPFFSVEEARRRNAGIMLQVRILSLDVTDLKPMHALGLGGVSLGTGLKNSPVVSAACGKFAATTSTQWRVGKDAYWDDLNWSFLMDDSLSLQFVVGSDKSTVGIVTVKPPTFVGGRADQKGVKRVTIPVFDEDRAIAGKLKITYTLGVIRESGYISRPSMDLRHVEEVTMPYNAKIGRVSVTGMPRVHLIGANHPQLRVQSDDWVRLSKVYDPAVARAQAAAAAAKAEADAHAEAIIREAKSGGADPNSKQNQAKNKNNKNKIDAIDNAGDNDSDAVWPAIGWSVPLLNDEIPLFFSLVSGKELIGSASVMPLDLLDVPKTRDGVTEFVATLYNLKGRNTGRLQVFMRCTAGGAGDAGNDIDFEDEELQAAMSALEKSIGDSGSGSVGGFAGGSNMSSLAGGMLPPLSRQQQQQQSAIDPASIFVPQSERNFRKSLVPEPLLPSVGFAGADAQLVSLPSFFTITIVSVAAISLRSVHLIFRNSPQVHVHCSDSSEIAFTSEIRRNAGKSANWDLLFWYFNVSDARGSPGTNISLEITSGDVLIGAISWSAADLYTHAKGKSGLIKKFDDVKSGTRYDGKIKLSYVINGPKPVEPVAVSPPTPEPAAETGAGGGGGEGEGGGDAVVAPAAKGGFSFGFGKSSASASASASGGGKAAPLPGPGVDPLALEPEAEAEAETEIDAEADDQPVTNFDEFSLMEDDEAEAEAEEQSRKAPKRKPPPPAGPRPDVNYANLSDLPEDYGGAGRVMRGFDGEDDLDSALIAGRAGGAGGSGGLAGRALLDFDGHEDKAGARVMLVDA